MNNTPYAHLSDEELLSRVYMDRELMSAIAIELAIRLEHALDELARPSETPLKVAETVDLRSVWP